MHVDITERKLAEQELNRIAYEDALTGLPSRNGFVHKVGAELERRGWLADAAVVLLDIQGQRDVNDAHGYEIGDTLLATVGARLQAAVEDAGVVGRIGDDEFAVFVPDLDTSDGQRYWTQVANAFDRRFDVDGVGIELEAHFGYTMLGGAARAMEDLLREAELALHESRRTPSGQRWTAFTPALDAAAQKRVAITRELRRALADREFELHFQPKVALDTGAIVSAEGLIRWHHPERGTIAPGEFVPIAEQSQLIAPIGDWVVRRACECLRAWRDSGLDTVRVAVNVSLVQFTVADFAAAVRDALDAFDVPASALSLEITESVFEHPSADLRRQLHQLHDRGVRLLLDDFGTGYSSLLYLQHYPFDEIKIDQGFVRNMGHDTYSRKIVTTVMAIASALGADVVAEGIEDAATRDLLVSEGCRFGQGYFLGRPMTAEDFQWLLRYRHALPKAGASDPA